MRQFYFPSSLFIFSHRTQTLMWLLRPNGGLCFLILFPFLFILCCSNAVESEREPSDDSKVSLRREMSRGKVRKR